MCSDLARGLPQDLDRVDVPTLIIHGDEIALFRSLRPVPAPPNDQGARLRRERRAALHHLDACGGVNAQLLSFWAKGRRRTKYRLSGLGL
jgi:hypothetical protein